MKNKMKYKYVGTIDGFDIALIVSLS